METGRRFSEEIMKAGDAHLLTILSHVKDQRRGLKPCRGVRENHRGLWK
jgi:hypothetical protein